MTIQDRRDIARRREGNHTLGVDMTPAPLRVPITNVYAGGDYTAQITIGSGGTTANVILDTGSSTLAVVPKIYDVTGDSEAETTSLAQDVIYGTGGWTGPVIKTNIALSADNSSDALSAYIAVTTDDEPTGFGNADGILGLAYNVLNNAYDLTSYLEQLGRDAVTFPWPFPVKNTSAAIRQFATLIARMPEQDLPPYFTALAGAGLEKNMFAFYTQRSVPSQGTAHPETDPLNQGYFIMGGGEEQGDLYTGTFANVKVVDDAWYNTNLLSVRVGDGAEVAAAQLPAQYGKTMISNSIVDSGTNSLALADDVYNAVINGLQEVSAEFGQAIEAAAQSSVDAASLDLTQWPDITFTLGGDTQPAVALTCAPGTYWQVDAPQSGQAMFMVGQSGMPQSILGLPLMNNYYCVFDRTADAYGVIRFAAMSPPAIS